ncbi:imidazolonepropionase [Flavobacteriaceae bacterium]|nr:imidazolonepropionase [Flavobacteriaceae bacterium]
MRTLFYNIKFLYQVNRLGQHLVKGNKMKSLPKLKNSYLIVENDCIESYGIMSELNRNQVLFDKEIDLDGRCILPGYIDSHTHLIFAKNREDEFVDRINGLSYEQIANRGGGILNSARKLQESSEDELYLSACKRLKKLISYGTTAIEIKSGYGLSTEAELKMLRVIKRLKSNFDMPIKATFLGAHALPLEFKDNPDEYIDKIISEMLPVIAQEELADYVDVFCEKGYFSAEQTNQILRAAKGFGLKPKIHTNQFNAIGGIEVAIKNKAISVDHLEVLSDSEIEQLKESNTIPVALPSCSYFLSIPYTPARKIMDADVPMALASDYNPGSTPSGNLNFVFATACIKMKMTPEEALNALTLNAAACLELSEEVGSIDKGKKASFIVTQAIESFYEIPYSFGDMLIDQVYINGKKQ